MANQAKGKKVRRVHDEWYFYDQLPTMIKLRLAASTQPWSCSHLLDRYRKRKAQTSRIEALSYMMDLLDSWDDAQATRACWEKNSFKTKNPVPTPCLVANVSPLITRFNADV